MKKNLRLSGVLAFQPRVACLPFGYLQPLRLAVTAVAVYPIALRWLVLNLLLQTVLNVFPQSDLDESIKLVLERL